MKKNFYLALAILFAVCIEGFSFAKKPKTDSVEGTFKYTGNDPFIQMVIQTQDGKSYTIKADDDISNSLKNEFGKKIKFYGTIIPNEKGSAPYGGKDGVLELVRFDVCE